MATPNYYLALSHADDSIVDSDFHFLTLFRNAPVDTYIVGESLIEATGRKAELIMGINWYYGVYLDAPGQRVDLAIQWLRDYGVKCERYTSRLLSESSYGQLPSGSVAAMVINVGNRPATGSEGE